MSDLDRHRFIVTRLHQGPWLVIDQVHNARPVASCPLEDDANAVAALMNRDPVDALRHVKFALDRLDILLQDREQSTPAVIASGKDKNASNVE